MLGPNTKRTDSSKRNRRIPLCNDGVEELDILDKSNNMLNFDGIGRKIQTWRPERSCYGQSYLRYREENASTRNEYGSRKFNIWNRQALIIILSLFHHMTIEQCPLISRIFLTCTHILQWKWDGMKSTHNHFHCRVAWSSAIVWAGFYSKFT